MPLQLSSPVTEIDRIGPAKAKYLAKLGITHARDFIFTFPRRHDDFSRVTNIKDLRAGQKMTVKGRIRSANSNWGFQGRRRIFRIFADIEDDTGIIAVTWYNLRFLQKQLWQGRQLSVAGTVEEDPRHQKQLDLAQQKGKDNKELQTTNSPASGGAPPAGGVHLQAKYRMRSPAIEFDDNTGTHTGTITPVYPETYGVTSRFLRYQVKNLLPLFHAVPEYMPHAIRRRNKLVGIHQAVEEIHFPSDTVMLQRARRRLRFDELFFLQLAALVRRQQRRRISAQAIKLTQKQLQHNIAELPFKLTGAQHTAIEEIMADLAKTVPMNRMLQGDVGSGKSAVALIAARAALQAKSQVLYLAPTEILARQQARTFTAALDTRQVKLLVGSTKERDKKKIKDGLRKKAALCVVGTHALLQEDVQTYRVGLAIIDEQHRFGVQQRSALLDSSKAAAPHLLSMTATPIPRTLNLTVYGDLDVSVLNELPPGRQPIDTKIVSPTQRDEAITHVLQELHAGRQAYVIAPLVEKSDRLLAKSAQEILDQLRRYFPDIAIDLVHGRLPPQEKKAVMNNFAAGAVQLLVATSVVEVGVDVPNATCMIIEGAERFGLAQLHQFRGRIGRGEHKSYCYLFPTTADAATNERLTVLAATTDGFKIAEEDLKLRGPGEVYGTSQSGFGDLQVASLLDYDMIKLTRSEAAKLLKQDPRLKKHPILRKKVEQKNLQTHFE